MHIALRTLALAAAGLFTALTAQADPSPSAPPFAVFVDRPTGFAFINTSMGWKYIRTLTTAQMEQLHESTLFAVGPQSKVEAEPFAVFVDTPSGNAYVNTPSGWRYTRTLAPAQLQQLPLSTLTRLTEPTEARPATMLAESK
jgi:hypothetical protein